MKVTEVITCSQAQCTDSLPLQCDQFLTNRMSYISKFCPDSADQKLHMFSCATTPT